MFDTVHFPAKRKRAKDTDGTVKRKRGDMQITCRDCADDFTISAAELKLCKELGKKRLRCDSCRQRRKDKLWQEKEAADAASRARPTQFVAGEREKRIGKKIKQKPEDQGKLLKPTEPKKEVTRHPACICHATPCYCGADAMEQPAAVVSETNPPPKACFNCGETGHLSADCKQPRTGNKFRGNGRDQKVCYKCKLVGHMGFECTAIVPRNAKKNDKKVYRRDVFPLPAAKKDPPCDEA